MISCGFAHVSFVVLIMDRPQPSRRFIHGKFLDDSPGVAPCHS
jgi:hypothetical protein